jgi:hypothetical protein
LIQKGLMVQSIPYERQDTVSLQRRCGAACLCMVYRSYGIELSQDEVWLYIARGDGRGQQCTRTYLLAAHALRRGLVALVTQTRDARATLRACSAQRVRAILNHRLGPASQDGHYSVLVAADEERVVLHDPERGPDLALAWQEWLPQWQAGGVEVTGPILVTFAQAPAAAAACSACGTALPECFVCRRCLKDVPLRPAAVLGCTGTDCPGRLWEKIFCPYCDTEITELADRFAPALR